MSVGTCPAWKSIRLNSCRRQFWRQLMTTLLVVDDHAVVREPLARLLRFEGYQTLCAANGVEALATLESHAVDLVLLDLMMPRKDGVGFMEALRGDSRRHDLPVLVLTSVIESSSLDRVRELGAAGVLPKARFTIEELVQTIRNCLGARVMT